MARKKSPESLKRRAVMMEMVQELDIKDANGLYEALRDLFAETMEMLQAEPDEHLGYGKHDQAPKATTNRRNGSTPKTVIGQTGEMDLQVPRDRDGTLSRSW